MARTAPPVRRRRVPRRPMVGGVQPTPEQCHVACLDPLTRVARLAALARLFADRPDWCCTAVGGRLRAEAEALDGQTYSRNWNERLTRLREEAVVIARMIDAAHPCHPPWVHAEPDEPPWLTLLCTARACHLPEGSGGLLAYAAEGMRRPPCPDPALAVADDVVRAGR